MNSSFHVVGNEHVFGQRMTRSHFCAIYSVLTRFKSLNHNWTGLEWELVSAEVKEDDKSTLEGS